jgi:hypothetical protein
VFENRVPRRIFGSERDEVAGSGEHFIMRSCMVCTLHQRALGRFKGTKWTEHVESMGEWGNA